MCWELSLQLSSALRGRCTIGRIRNKCQKSDKRFRFLYSEQVRLVYEMQQESKDFHWVTPIEGVLLHR